MDGDRGEGTSEDSAHSSGLGSGHGTCTRASISPRCPQTGDGTDEAAKLPPPGLRQWLVCHPPTTPSPARAPQGHLQPVTSPESLCGPQPHASSQPYAPGVCPASPLGFEGSPIPKQPQGTSSASPPISSGRGKLSTLPFGTVDARTWAGAARCLFDVKGIFSPTFKIN